jgi:alkanesulfonate monooxygenase SsuD/methylene tetrahydromethanopterin reductase-like flavin-dependent oxidoreductase (luciferase family)
MLGIDPLEQRHRMDESLGIIMRLLTETEPITYESDWFVLRDAVVHLRPYTQPHFPVVVAAAQSPIGMQLAGKYGAGVLSVSVIRDRGTAPDLHKFWQIAEETAAEYGHTVHREDWRMVVAVFLADSRKEAMAQARVGAGRFQREYFEGTIGLPAVIDGPPDKIIDAMVEGSPGPGDRVGHAGASIAQLRTHRTLCEAPFPRLLSPFASLSSVVCRQERRTHGPAHPGDREGQAGILYAEW